MKKIFSVLLVAFLLVGCTNYAQPQDPIPAHDSFKIQSTIVGEARTINVWTPPGYAQGADSLPVIYMPDGGINEDFPHIANTIAELIKNKKIPASILVGIENTQRRRDLSGPTVVEEDKKIAPIVGESAKFRNFIKEELFGEINKRYRTTNRKGIIGESLAGLFIVETFFVAPDMFDFYIAMDPSLWWNDQYLLKTANTTLDSFTTAEKQIWFAGSNAKDIKKHTNELAKIFASKNSKNIKWQYADEPKEKHNTIYRATKEKALIWIFHPTQN